MFFGEIFVMGVFDAGGSGLNSCLPSSTWHDTNTVVKPLTIHVCIIAVVVTGYL